MSRRLDYRLILPVAHLLLFVLLVGYGDRELLQTISLYRDVRAESSQPDVLWDPVYIDRAMPLSKVLAYSINLPAAIFAFPFAHLQKGWRAEFLLDAVTAAYLLPLWFAVGRWIDSRDRNKLRSGSGWVAVRRTTFALSCLAGLGILLVLVAGLVRRTGEWPVFLLSLPALFWPAFLAYVARWELRVARSAQAEVLVG